MTGGSSGIGLAIARMLREEGHALTLAARRLDRLEEAARELGAHVVALDVRRKQSLIFEQLGLKALQACGRGDTFVHIVGQTVPQVAELATEHAAARA